MERQKGCRFHLTAEPVERFLQHLSAPFVGENLIRGRGHGDLRRDFLIDFRFALFFLPQEIDDAGADHLIEIGAESGLLRVVFHDQIVLEEFEHDVLEHVAAFPGGDPVSGGQLEHDRRVPVIEFLPGDFVARLDTFEQSFMGRGVYTHIGSSGFHDEYTPFRLKNKVSIEFISFLLLY